MIFTPRRSPAMVAFAATLLALMLLIATDAPASAAEKPIFVWWGNPKTLTNVSIASAVPTADIEYWRNRGGLAAGFVGLGPPKLGGYIQTGQGELLRQKLEERAAEGYPAIALEVERQTDATDAAVLRAFKEAHPDVFIAAWLYNSRDRHPYSQLRDGVDLFIYEVYFDYGHPDGDFYRFAGEARRGGVTGKSIFALSVVGVPAGETEREFRLIRKLAPEMPGIAFFQFGNPVADAAADRLGKKYFIDPLLEIKPDDFTAGKRDRVSGDIVKLRVNVRNIGFDASKADINIYDKQPGEKERRIAKTRGITVKGQSQKTIVYRWRPAPGKHRLTARLAGGEYLVLPGVKEARTTINVKRPFWLPPWSGLNQIIDGRIDW